LPSSVAARAGTRVQCCWRQRCEDSGGLVDVPRALGIEAQAVRAKVVIVVDTAAISAVPVTVAVVVSIVTVAVASPRGLFTRIRSRTGIDNVRIEAFAICAKVVVGRNVAAVTAVPVAATMVVAIIAVTVSLPRRLFARLRALQILHLRIQAVAVGTVVELRVLTAVPATIAFIPVTTTVVVSIVAEAISDIRQLRAGRATIRGFVVWVEARAVGTIIELLGFPAVTTTISFIPITATVVIAVVAEAITNKVGLSTRCTAFLEREFWIQALAISAVICFDRCAAAVTSIPITATVVVVVVTETVALERRLFARSNTRHIAGSTV